MSEITTEQRDQWRADAKTLHLGMSLRTPADRILWLLDALEEAEGRARRFAANLANQSVGANEAIAQLRAERDEARAALKWHGAPATRTACLFPGCPEQPTTVSGMCGVHRNVRVSGSHVDDKNKTDRGHG